MYSVNTTQYKGSDMKERRMKKAPLFLKRVRTTLMFMKSAAAAINGSGISVEKQMKETRRKSR